MEKTWTTQLRRIYLVCQWVCWCLFSLHWVELQYKHWIAWFLCVNLILSDLQVRDWIIIIDREAGRQCTWQRPSARPSVCPSVCLSVLSRLNHLTFHLHFWHECRPLPITGYELGQGRRSKVKVWSTHFNYFPACVLLKVPWSTWCMVWWPNNAKYRDFICMGRSYFSLFILSRIPSRSQNIQNWENLCMFGTTNLR